MFPFENTILNIHSPDKTHISKFSNSPPCTHIESIKSTTYIVFLEIDQNYLGSIKYMPKVHFFSKLSDSSWRLCVSLFITILHFCIFNSNLKSCCVEIQISTLFLHNMQKFYEAFLEHTTHLPRAGFKEKDSVG
jgi:hypothetical protein